MSRIFRTLIPLFGIFTFVLLYFTAILLYPGGSQTDKTAVGFSFLHNYWCDLFAEVAYNGQPNPAHFVAIAAMLVLCPSIGLLWFWLPRLFQKNNIKKDNNDAFLYKIIQYSGVFAMCVTLFLFTNLHDAVINIAGFSGAIGVFCFLYILYKTKNYALLGFGMLCFVLSALNFVVYQSGILLYILPLLQKITFLLFFVWAGWINVRIARTDSTRI